MKIRMRTGSIHNHYQKTRETMGITTTTKQTYIPAVLNKTDILGSSVEEEGGDDGSRSCTSSTYPPRGATGLMASPQVPEELVSLVRRSRTYPRSPHICPQLREEKDGRRRRRRRRREMI